MRHLSRLLLGCAVSVAVIAAVVAYLSRPTSGDILTREELVAAYPEFGVLLDDLEREYSTPQTFLFTQFADTYSSFASIEETVSWIYDDPKICRALEGKQAYLLRQDWKKAETESGMLDPVNTYFRLHTKSNDPCRFEWEEKAGPAELTGIEYKLDGARYTGFAQERFAYRLVMTTDGNLLILHGFKQFDRDKFPHFFTTMFLGGGPLTEGMKPLFYYDFPMGLAVIE